MADLLRLPDAALIAVRCAPAVLDAVSGSLPGWSFPREANRFSVIGSRTILWTGPDDWLVVDEAEKLPEMLAALEAAFTGHHAAVVDVSGNRVRLGLSGRRSRETMARACSLDLAPPRFGVGHCAGTIVARAQAFVLQRDDAPSYEILARRSFARYLTGWFASAGRGLGDDAAVPLYRD